MRIQANGIALEVDDQGPPAGEPVLLIMGLGMQLTGWPQEMVDDLVRRGHRVVRFDNRDAGLSESFDAHGMPNLAWAAVRYALHFKVHAFYTLQDMAEDARGVLDVLGIARAHVCGASMGGMIAQHLAARHPERVASLTLMMTTSGARALPQARPAVRRALLDRPTSHGTDDVVDHLLRFLHLIGSPGYRPDPQQMRARLHAAVTRSYRPSGTARQLLAVAADGDRSPLLRQIVAPTRVIHGKDDPLVPVAAAHDLVAKITGANPDIVNGMGHDLPLELLPHFAQGIAANAARARG